MLVLGLLEAIVAAVLDFFLSYVNAATMDLLEFGES